MNSPFQLAETALLASQPPSAVNLMQLILLVLLVGGGVLFSLALLLAVLRVGRRRFARERAADRDGEGGDRFDAWRTSAGRMELDPVAPTEEDPDRDLPPMGGRFQ